MNSVFTVGIIMGLATMSHARVMKVVDNYNQPRAQVQVTIETQSSKIGFHESWQSISDADGSGGKVVLVTNGRGEFTVPTEWKSPQTVTLEGNDLVRTTYYQVSPTREQLQINEADGNQKIEVQGVLSGFSNIKNGDGKVDVGVIMPAIAEDQILSFDLGSLISSEKDIITVLNQEVAVPANVAFPEQRESYFFPITLNKPTFRMSVRKPGSYQFLALHGQFPLSQVVDQYRRGVPAYDLINYISLLKSNLVKIDVSNKIQDLNIPVSGINFSGSINAKAPNLAGDDLLLTVALSKIAGTNILIPSDVKRLKSNETKALKISENAVDAQALSVLFKEKSNFNFSLQYDKPLDPTSMESLSIPTDILYDLFKTQGNQSKQVNFNQFSLALHPKANSQPAPSVPNLLNLVDEPRVNGTALSLSPPPLNNAIQPLGILVIYSAITLNNKAEQRTKLWELWVPNWSSQIVLPNLPSLRVGEASYYRWEVLFLGSSNVGNNSTVTHVSRNMVEIK
ncbi:MAG: hypothetical protein K1X29_02015 [Bdellovibrionales bacterium]|nr:hypothetical protein [Bdellovibrionales bacterium]